MIELESSTELALERVSIEVTNRCSKGCPFCYNASGVDRGTTWDADALVAFSHGCARHGVQAISFGGGEPLEFEGIFDVLTRTRGRVFRSITTNGLRLKRRMWERLLGAQPEKVHVSIHCPDDEREIERVIGQVNRLAASGVRSGVNLVVARSKLEESAQAAEALRDAGISNDRIVYLPMRGFDTPTPLLHQEAEVHARSREALEDR